MIKLSNIELKDGIISVLVESHEGHPLQKYTLLINASTGEAASDLVDADKYDMAKVVNKLMSYIEQGAPLPQIDCVATH